MDWGLRTGTTTLVLYMPGADYAEVVRADVGERPSGRPSVCDRLEPPLVHSSKSLVLRWPSRRRRKVARAGLVDRRRVAFARCH